MRLGGLVEVSPALGDPVLRGLLDGAYRASARAPMGLALPWSFRERVNALLNPSVQAMGIHVHGLQFLDVHGGEALDVATWTPLVIASSRGFRRRLQRRGILPLTPVEGLRRLEGRVEPRGEHLESQGVCPSVGYELMSSG